MSQAELSPAIQTFLKLHGLGDARVDALPSDASARRYYRLPGTGKLLMEDPNDPVGFAAFVRLARHLAELGLSVPSVLIAEADDGLALIEDFGTDTYGALLAQGHDEEALYALAIDTLVHLHSHPRSVEVAAPAYNSDVLLEEVSRFSHWFVPSFAPEVDVASFDAKLRPLWERAFVPLADAPQTLVLRDFHIDNLMLLNARTGVAACGLLDFQDGVIGAGEYDLMSLLQDARRDLGAGLEGRMLARYLAAIPPACGTAEQITARYSLLAAQRHTRLAGQFLRLHQRDGKPGYLRFMPRVMGQMQTALDAAGLTEIANLLDTTLPGWRDAGATLSHVDG